MNYMMKGANKNPKKLIDFFGGEYDFLCNFYERPVFYNGLLYGSSEAAFASMKTADPLLQAEFVALSPGVAKARGRRLALRLDWDAIKLRVMSEVVHAKFMQHRDLAAKLMNTGKAKLVEGNTWNDRIWGTVDGVGLNWLGCILTAERAYLNRLNTDL